MEIILTEDIPRLGKMGEVVKVKDGYARNLLIPRKKAYLATPVNLRKIEEEKRKRLVQLQEEKKTTEALAEKLNKVSCTISVEVNDLERLYGAVTELDIARVLSEEGFQIDKKNILLEKPIEELGIYEVSIKLHPEVIAKIRVWVTKK